MYKKTFLSISLLFSRELLLSNSFEHHSELSAPAASSINTASHQSSTSHITTSTQGVSGSSKLIGVLQDIASAVSSPTQVSALTSIVQHIDSGITTFDISTLEQALQEGLQLLASSGGRFGPLTIIEYTGILIETISELEAARAQSAAAAATSTVVTSTAA